MQHSITTHNLRVDFHWLDDRFGHTVSIVRGDKCEVVLRSHHIGDHAPAFQELHEQKDAGGESIYFLSGASDGAHWSMSVQRETNAISFDVAARVAKPPSYRPIEYAIDPDVGCSIRIESRDPATVVSNTGSSILVEENVGRDAPLPTTLRWQYAVTIGGESDRKQ